MYKENLTAMHVSVKRHSLNSCSPNFSLKSNNPFPPPPFLGMWSLFQINPVLIKMMNSKSGQAGKEVLQNFRISFDSCSEAGTDTPGFPTILLSTLKKKSCKDKRCSRKQKKGNQKKMEKQFLFSKRKENKRNATISKKWISKNRKYTLSSQ